MLRPSSRVDDFLAAAVAAEEQKGGAVVVASGDRDSFQLASESTTILYPLRAGEMARVDPAEVRKRYGLDPKQVPDFIALRGDPSDKLPSSRGLAVLPSTQSETAVQPKRHSPSLSPRRLSPKCATIWDGQERTRKASDVGRKRGQRSRSLGRGSGAAATLWPLPYETGDLLDAERRVLECLGAALVSEWNGLPTDVQRRLFEHAASGTSRGAAQLKSQIARFLHDHKDASESR
jgi:hypothetical protein